MNGNQKHKERMRESDKQKRRDTEKRQTKYRKTEKTDRERVTEKTYKQIEIVKEMVKEKDRVF